MTAIAEVQLADAGWLVMHAGEKLGLAHKWQRYTISANTRAAG